MHPEHGEIVGLWAIVSSKSHETSAVLYNVRMIRTHAFPDKPMTRGVSNMWVIYLQLWVENHSVTVCYVMRASASPCYLELTA